jgi:hypothetical protein
MPAVAQRLRDDQRCAVLALSPGERVALALRLGARDLESFRLAAIPSQTVAEARRTLEQRRQSRRRRSRCLAEAIG